MYTIRQLWDYTKMSISDFYTRCSRQMNLNLDVFKAEVFETLIQNVTIVPISRKPIFMYFLNAQSVSRSIRDFVRKNVQILLRGKPSELFRITLNVFPEGVSGNIQKMVTGLLQIAFHVIWNNRNQFKFKQKITTFQESFNTILKQFKSAIDAEFQTLDPRKVSQRFCHTSNICKTHNNRLVVKLYFCLLVVLSCCDIAYHK
jgi:hypothetical protein